MSSVVDGGRRNRAAVQELKPLRQAASLFARNPAAPARQCTAALSPQGWQPRCDSGTPACFLRIASLPSLLEGPPPDTFHGDGDSTTDGGSALHSLTSDESLNSQVGRSKHERRKRGDHHRSNHRSHTDAVKKELASAWHLLMMHAPLASLTTGRLPLTSPLSHFDEGHVDDTCRKRVGPLKDLGKDAKGQEKPHAPQGPWCVHTKPSETRGVQELGDTSCLCARLRSSASEDAREAQERRLTVKELRSALAYSQSSVCSLKGSKALPNQDRALIAALPDGAELLCVFDGHGDHGHLVADFVAAHMPQLLVKGLTTGLDECAGFHGLADGKENHEDSPSSTVSWKAGACRAFHTMQSALEELTQRSLDTAGEVSEDEAAMPRFDARSSGTTGTMMLLLEDGGALVAHVGDSRAVIGIRPRWSNSVEKGPWRVRNLTNDHKTDVASERKRIEASGASVMKCGAGERVVTAGQVWPAINMTRSLGDLHPHTQGVVATPDVSMAHALRTVVTEEAIIVIGSDGLWDVMKAEEVIAFAAEHPPSEAAGAIAQEALARWRKLSKKNPAGPYSDDITVVVKFL